MYLVVKHQKRMVPLVYGLNNTNRLVCIIMLEPLGTKLTYKQLIKTELHVNIQKNNGILLIIKKQNKERS